METSNRAFHFLLNLVPILISIAITSLLIVLVGHNPLEVFSLIWEGAFGNLQSFAGVINFWMPLTLLSMGLIVTFTAGLWNIGVEGQMMMGAVAASWAARTFVDLPSPLLIGTAIVLSIMGGMFWAWVVGVLKTRLGINEIFGGVALNALANVYSIYLIAGPWQSPEGGNAQSTEPFIQSSWLPSLSDEFPINLAIFVIVIVAVISVIRLLTGTRWGLQLRATGKNPRSALLLGVNVEMSVWSALMLCGGLAGIAGAYRVLFTYHSLRPLVSGGIGFLGLLVVLLVSIRALWVPMVTLIFAAILAGSTRLRIALQLDQSLAGVLQGIVVLSVLLFQGIRERFIDDKDSD